VNQGLWSTQPIRIVISEGLPNPTPSTGYCYLAWPGASHPLLTQHHSIPLLCHFKPSPGFESLPRLYLYRVRNLIPVLANVEDYSEGSSHLVADA